MMKQMRDNTKWIMLITAAAFVALMVFEWGMDASGRSAMGIGQVGSVNGDPVMYDDWMSTYRMLYDETQAQQEDPISTQQNEDLEDQAWDETVNQMLIQQELARRDIRVTEAEIQRGARFSPPPQLMQSPAFQDAEGNFDPQLYQDFLANSADQATLLQLEQYYRSLIPRNKLMRQLTSGLYPSNGDLWQRYRDRNEQATVRYAVLEAAEEVDDSEVTVSDEEIEEYYDENREDFRVPAQANLRIAVLPMAPSASDTTEALERATQIRQDIVDGVATFEEMAQLESMDEASAQQGGDLGTFIRGQMVAPFEEAAFSAEAGEITEPVRSQFGYHIIRVRENYGDSVAASHILVPIERTDDSELQLLMNADSLEAMGETMTLEQAASNLGIEANTVTINEDFPVAAGAGVITEAFEWAQEEAAPGDVSPVFENDQAFYMVELIDYRPEGYRTVDEARDQIRQTLLVRKKQDILVERAAEIVEEARSQESLAAAAEAAGLESNEAGPFTRNQPIPGIGRVPELSGAAFGLDEGEISEPIPAQNDVYLLQLLNRTEADSTAWLAQLDQQRNQLVYQLQQERLTQWVEGMRAQATIRDQRDEVLQAAEEAQENQPMGAPMPF